MSQAFQFHITAAEAGRRLDEFLASRFGSLSRMRLSNLIRAGACTINQSVMPSGWRLAVGDLIEVTLTDAAPTAMEPERIPLEVVYEDAHLIVISKPAGMLVHPTMSVKRGTLANALAYHLNREFYENADLTIADLKFEISDSQISAELRPRQSAIRNPQSAIKMPAHGEAHTLIRPGLAHRLDRATSGLMVVAKTARALSLLSRHFRRRLIEKRYLALVTGRLAEDAGEVSAPIGRDPQRRPVWWVTPDGKQAVTRFSVRERFTAATLVDLEPVTGRTNQLRIHLAYSSHPILGDELYGDAGTQRHGDAATRSHGPQKAAAAGWRANAISDDLAADVAASPCRRVAASRLCLHAWRLAFHHPDNNEWMEFTSPLPADFAACVDEVR